MTLLRDISLLWSMLHIVLFMLILFEPRYSWRFTTVVSLAGAGTLLAGNVLLMYWFGNGILMSAAFFTCTIPTLLLFFLLSAHRDGRFFFLFCMSDTLCFWLLQITNFLDRFTGETYVVLLISRLVLFPAVEFLFWRYLRQPFIELQQKLTRDWWLFTAMGAVYYLLIMFTAIPVDAPMPGPEGVARICLVLILMPLTYMTILYALWRQLKVYESRRQMELQRRDYESIREKMELGRVYRHDMRHHLAALDGMLQQGDVAGARQYVRTLTGGLEDITCSAQCSNSAVNAVLTAYLVQAGNAGCTVDTKINLPEHLPFDETDLCVVLANPLENAIHACQGLPENQRKIRLEMELTENQRLIVSMENPCPQPVKFGPNGLPAVQAEEGHGLGLHSVQTVANKYGGLFRCQWEDGRFLLRIVLIPPVREAAKRPRTNQISAALLGMLLFLVLLNCMPALADSLESIPVLGAIFRVVDLRTYALDWKGGELFVRQPGVEGQNLSPQQSTGVDGVNAQSDSFIRQMEEQFLWYAERRYEGNTGVDVDYTVLRDDSQLLILRFDATVNVGGSVNYSRHVLLDKASGKILTLKDLFVPDSDYVSPLSAEVLRQMEEAAAAGDDSYFIPGNGWPEADCFKAIDPEQDFYLDENGQLVLVFEEYAVAPGSMGTPQFTIPGQVAEDIRVQPPSAP